MPWQRARATSLFQLLLAFVIVENHYLAIYCRFSNQITPSHLNHECSGNLIPTFCSFTVSGGSSARIFSDLLQVKATKTARLSNTRPRVTA